MDLTAAAAFTAAGLSLINVVVTARMAGRERLTQWRREELQPIVARILALSRETRDEWRKAAVAQLLRLGGPDSLGEGDDIDSVQKREREGYANGKAAWDKLCFEVAQLQLIAAKPVSDAAEALRLSHESLGLGLNRGAKTTRAAERKITESVNIDINTGNLIREVRIALGAPDSVRRRTRWPGLWRGSGTAS
jgi:hypothetical protein